jgi:hypothetical protein
MKTRVTAHQITPTKFLVIVEIAGKIVLQKVYEGVLD